MTQTELLNKLKELESEIEYWKEKKSLQFQLNNLTYPLKQIREWIAKKERIHPDIVLELCNVIERYL